MKKIFTFLLLLSAMAGNAQKVSGIVKGHLQDISGDPLPEATITVMRSQDSTLVGFTLTSSSGYFESKNLNAGNYYLMLSYQGFESIKKSFSITSEKPMADLGAVKLEKAYKTLGEVVVTDEVPIRIKGDTLSYNANSFKTKPNANVEELLKKLPGVQVERDGTVKAQGENVQKVYVDGKEFFGNDPKLATRNLSADMIESVDVFDDMSEQSKFNKIDDGSRSKAINLKLKKDKKKGVFGKVYGGYGTEDRYDAGLSTNFFKGATQVSVIAKANNTNNLGFTMSDMMGMFGSGGFGGFSGGGMGGMMGGGSSMMSMGGGGMGGMRMMGSGPAMLGGGASSGPTGITKSATGGINYRDVWSPKLDIASSYFFNHANAFNQRNSFRQTFLADSSQNATRQTTSENNNNNHRINLNLNWKLDSLNSIVYTPNINFQNSELYSDDTLGTVIDNKSKTYMVNESRTMNESAGHGVNWNNNLIWRRKLNKPGRTLSVSLSNTYGRTERDGFTRSKQSFFNRNGFKVKDSLINQQFTVDGLTDNYGINISYTEPLSRTKIWEVNYGYNNNRNESDRITNAFDALSGKYEKPVAPLTNHFVNQNVFSRVGTNLRFVQKKYNYQLGIAVQQTLLESDNLSTKTNIRQRYTNLFPTASFNYQFARNRSLRFNYRGRTNQPTVTQLQPIRDVSNPPYFSEGNPDLRQEFINNFTLSYNFFDMIKFRNMFAFVTFGNTYNKIVNSTTQLGLGNQLTRPENVDGTYFLSGNFNFGLPIKRMKGGNFNTTTRISYNRDASLIDDEKNFIKNLSIGEDLRLSYNYKEKLDLGVTASINYNSVGYTIQQQRNDDFFTHVYSADFTYTFKKGLILSTDIDYTANTGRADGFNQNFTMWNASIAKQVLKSKRGEVKVSVYDILKQNQSITRNVRDNYIEDVQNNVLQRFFSLSFTYNINRMGGKSMMPRNLERATRGVRIGM
jgi:outer membrane receptor protein involved in Fe transport